MRHPSLGEWDCPPNAVAAYEEKGWTVVPDDQAAPPNSTPRKPRATKAAAAPATSDTPEE
jgi:hypothetical protein